MREIKLSNRLRTAASYVRSGAFVADIGTDHAYLPIYLVTSGTAKRALASDINEGPILKARENISRYGLNDRISTQIAAGLDGIEKIAPTDIVICGMGGELIARILDASSYVKKEGIRLVLQPMTCAMKLREYLQNGYSIVDESIVCEDGKIYQIICAEYDGKEHTYSKIELELGQINIMKKSSGYKELLFSTIAKKEKKLNGLRIGGQDTTDIEEEFKELERLKNEIV